MQKHKKLFVHALLLCSLPSIILHSQANVPFTLQLQSPVEKSETASSISYDDILNLLKELEEGDLEKRSTPAQLERINCFLANLAMQGSLHDNHEEEAILERDSRAFAK